MTDPISEAPSKGGAVGVFVVDDHGVVRRGMRAFLDMIEDIRVLGEAADGQEALKAIEVLVAEGQPPDVVMMDLLMPGMDGIAATAALKDRWPTIDVVAMTSFSEAGRVQDALEAGASGYLLKDAEAGENPKNIKTP